MKLYFFPVAPNPTKVRVYLGEKGIDVPHELVNLREGQQSKPDFLAKNPMAKLPANEIAPELKLSPRMAAPRAFAVQL